MDFNTLTLAIICVASIYYFAKYIVTAKHPELGRQKLEWKKLELEEKKAKAAVTGKWPSDDEDE